MKMWNAADVQNKLKILNKIARTRTIASDVCRSKAVAMRDEGASSWFTQH